MVAAGYDIEDRYVAERFGEEDPRREARDVGGPFGDRRDCLRPHSNKHLRSGWEIGERNLPRRSVNGGEGHFERTPLCVVLERRRHQIDWRVAHERGDEIVARLEIQAPRIADLHDAALA